MTKMAKLNNEVEGEKLNTIEMSQTGGSTKEKLCLLNN